MNHFKCFTQLNSAPPIHGLVNISREERNANVISSGAVGMSQNADVVRQGSIPGSSDAENAGCNAVHRAETFINPVCQARTHFI